VWTPCPTTSNFTSLSHISPRPFSRAPNEMPVASAGTLSTTSYIVHGRVPRIARCSILSNPTAVSPLSILIHNPAQPATSFDRIHVRNRTRLPAYWVALIDCISVPNPPVSWTVETRYSNLLMIPYFNADDSAVPTQRRASSRRRFCRSLVKILSPCPMFI
jgi:hypothetical protein